MNKTERRSANMGMLAAAGAFLVAPFLARASQKAKPVRQSAIPGRQRVRRARHNVERNA